MAILTKGDIIDRYNLQQSTLLEESRERRFAGRMLRNASADFSALSSYDIFLSHSYDDARVIKQVRDMLVEKGFSVYVDWIEDDHLDRGKVTPESASVLRRRMNACNSLLYITSESAEKSVWMPWELGYMDSRTGRVAVAPILDDEPDFEGREYLGLYPYLDLTNDSFYIHRSSSEWVGFTKWMSGEEPQSH
ncbi:MAG: TIR domain-containing protein [Sedimenticola sp.]